MLATVLFALATATAAFADDTPGVTATEIKIGNTNPYSGPASAYSVIAKLETAFFKMVNDQGGVADHKINFISLDDGYSPPMDVIRLAITSAITKRRVSVYIHKSFTINIMHGEGIEPPTYWV